MAECPPGVHSIFDPCPGNCTEPVTARELVLSILYGEYPWPEKGRSRKEDIDEILKVHAHELAEKIRNSEELRDFTDDHMSDCNAAADLIDPEVS